jgi:UDP-N-acetylglucosamine--N-acetylmuramyl-(pentapeptide) pyrophosphoryl-undecaprenol N-acetylglucosamine transferase
MKVIFAGAGTAGHVEPALAVANWLRVNRPEIDLLFLGTSGGIENSLVPDSGFKLLLIDKTPFPRRLGKGLFTWPLKFRHTVEQTRKALIGADLVVGFGGYVAAPAYVAAWRMGLPIIAHEANAKMGLANRLAKWCGAKMLRAFGEGSGVGVGIPLRNSIVELAKVTHHLRTQAKQKALQEMKLDLITPTILVFGGSIGSAKFNEVILEARREILQKGFQIIHIVGAKNELPRAQAGYYPVTYFKDMASAYAATDLVISRSGAVTVTETGVLGIYSLYVPLPIGNGEQLENAREVVSQGGGAIIANEKFTVAWLLENIVDLMKCASAWSDQSKKMKFPLNASEQISLEILKVLNDE